MQHYLWMKWKGKCIGENILGYGNPKSCSSKKFNFFYQLRTTNHSHSERNCWPVVRKIFIGSKRGGWAVFVIDTLLPEKSPLSMPRWSSWVRWRPPLTFHLIYYVASRASTKGNVASKRNKKELKKWKIEHSRCRMNVAQNADEIHGLFQELVHSPIKKKNKKNS